MRIDTTYYEQGVRKELAKKLAALAVTDTRIKHKKTLIAYKGGKCSRCGLETEHYSVYHFHHKDPAEKDFSISHSGRNRSLAELKKEVDKCDLVCANCHAIIHAIEYQQSVEKRLEKLKNEYEFARLDTPIHGNSRPDSRRNKGLRCRWCNKYGSNYCNVDCRASFKVKQSINKQTIEELLVTKNIGELCKQFNIGRDKLTTVFKLLNVEYTANHFRIQWPSKEELEKMLWEMPITDISNRIGVSDVAILKKIKIYGITNKPKRGYWLNKERRRML